MKPRLLIPPSYPVGCDDEGCTPTEAAGIGALYMLLLALAYRTVRLRQMIVIFRDTASITAQIMLIIGASAVNRLLASRSPGRGQALLGFRIIHRLPADHQCPSYHPGHDPRADIGPAHHHPHPAAGGRRVRYRPLHFGSIVIFN
jgi:hypothetical protein